MSELSRYTMKITKKVFLTPDMLEIYFEKPADFTFQAGQFIQVIVPDQQSQSPLLRSYSLASAPFEPHLALCIKIVPGGRASTYLSALRVGDTLELRGPEGRFTVMDAHAPQKTFVATGAGIAPIMSILEDEVRKPTNEHLRLVFGVRHERDILWLERLQVLEELHPNFSVLITLSQPSGAWTGRRGRVTERIPELPAEGEWYLCGSPPMVKDVRALLIAKGVKMQCIHFEIF